MALARSELKGRAIGLLGGTFDPVHNGHLAAVRVAREELGLDGVFFIPASRPPHKPSYRVSSFEHRVAMLKAAIGESHALSVCQIEKDRPGPSYTIDTLTQLNKELAGYRFYFIIGADAFAEIYSWKDYKDLPGQAHLVVMNRPDCGGVSVSKEILSAYFPAFAYDQSSKAWRAPGALGNIYCLEMPYVDISSSLVRKRVAAGLDVSGLVPKMVVDYINEHELYAAGGPQSLIGPLARS